MPASQTIEIATAADGNGVEVREGDRLLAALRVVGGRVMLFLFGDGGEVELGATVGNRASLLLFGENGNARAGLTLCEGQPVLVRFDREGDPCWAGPVGDGPAGLPELVASAN